MRMNNYKRTILLTQLCILIFFLSCNSRENVDRLSTEIYVDSKHYFAIHTPIDWQIQEYPQDPRGKVVFIGPKNNIDLRILASQKNFNNFEDLFNTTQENAKDIKKRFGISVNLQKTTFLDRQAVKREWEFRGVKCFAIEFMEGNIRHDLQYGAPQRFFNKYLPIVLKAMETYHPTVKGLSEEDVKRHQIANILRLAKIFLEQDNLDLALEYLKEGLEIEPQNQELLKLKKKIEDKRKD